jgi:hypothetical protein
MPKGFSASIHAFLSADPGSIRSQLGQSIFGAAPQYLAAFELQRFESTDPIHCLRLSMEARAAQPHYRCFGRIGVYGAPHEVG